MSSLDDLAKMINGIIGDLPPQTRSDLIGKLQAAATDNASKIGTMSAERDDALMAARDALVGKAWPTPIQASAANPKITNELKLLQKNCSRLGYAMTFDKVFSLADFDKATAGKDPNLRMAAKRTANLLGLCL
jgi:hypothetical protein